jgi:hypothetical protein
MAPASTMNIPGILAKLEIAPVNSGACGAGWIEQPSGAELISLNPATGAEIARVRMAGSADYDRIVSEAAETFRQWRLVPAPKRGQIVREYSKTSASGAGFQPDSSLPPQEHQPGSGAGTAFSAARPIPL